MFAFWGKLWAVDPSLKVTYVAFKASSKEKSTAFIYPQGSRAP